MAVIAIFSASYCHGNEVAAGVIEQLRYTLQTDETLIDAAADGDAALRDQLRSAMFAPPGFFNRLTREKERHVATLRARILDVIEPDNIVYHGFGALLVPGALTHVMRVTLAATTSYRLGLANTEHRTPRESERKITESDETAATWTQFLYDLAPWDKSLCDVFIPMQTTSPLEAVKQLCAYARRPALATTPETPTMMRDARLAASVNALLVERGHDTDVSCTHGQVTILIRDYVLRMGRLQDRLESLARTVPGVVEATARPGPRCTQPSVYGQMDIAMPSRVLLVDDERDFVHALSERLQRRQMSPSIAYSGDQALSIVESEQPEVMILDLKMPGIDGMEVLRRVKAAHPSTEVIILTGHGSDAEEVLAMELGAFAYLKKPVDIDLLSRTMHAAYEHLAESDEGIIQPENHTS